ncbi:hypothetical protein [Mucilaginibacter myungsuensis]|uniref:Tail terminator n=1 Tax=Mucilaginibacter myungsuensis TaxID=649104 RepID=A0A929PX46_9SPHI|nr:hypothetical protein [Mucilaginibacter myungsuensis]MBE9662015.1 hypothetical protein [Mucilaginibacter myungsuensis]MDN3599552.1 hypothetical protein [Mucilaginibacter myungsuensis]
MPIRNQIAAIVQQLHPGPNFLYGDQGELNTLADDAGFPCVFMYPLQNIGINTSVNGSVDNNFTIYLEFLYRTDFGQYTADNETYVAQALQLANQFLVKAGTYRDSQGRYFRVKPGEKAKCLPVYNKYDVNSTGVGLTVTLAAMYSPAV